MSLQAKLERRGSKDENHDCDISTHSRGEKQDLLDRPNVGAAENMIGQSGSHDRGSREGI